MSAPGSYNIDLLINFAEEFMNELMKRMNKYNTEMGNIADALPLEFFMDYPHLCKFMYYKWGHYFVKTPEYFNFSEWKLPEKCVGIHTNIRKCYMEYKLKLYIGDRSLVWNLINDIKYFNLIHALSSSDTELIKEDLHLMLDDMETIAAGNSGQEDAGGIELYVTSLNMGLSSAYYLSENNYLSLFKTFFLRSGIHRDYNTGHKVQLWIHSLKKVSTLISGSGEKERRLFFEDQHLLVDTV